VNRKQRKAKQQRANQHRKIAKTVEYKRKQTESQVAAYREHDSRLNCHWLDEPIPEMRVMTDKEWRTYRLKILAGFVVCFVLIILVAVAAKWVSP
jgi:hypothetical protein